MDPHLSNPVPSWRVVVQQPVEQVQAHGDRPEVGSATSIPTEAVYQRRRLRHREVVKEYDFGIADLCI